MIRNNDKRIADLEVGKSQQGVKWPFRFLFLQSPDSSSRPITPVALGCFRNLVAILFSRTPNPDLAIFINFDIDNARVTANGAILNVLLLTALRKINRDNNLFATRIANVTRFAVQINTSQTKSSGLRCHYRITSVQSCLVKSESRNQRRPCEVGNKDFARQKS